MDAPVLTSKSLIGSTRAQDVLHRLREDIISCALKPGDRLRFEYLHKIYDVSFSTLREALTTLASEQLVVMEGQRGYSVAPISREDVIDMTNARVLIECECIALSLANGDDQWESQVLAAFHRLDRLEARLGDDYAATPEWNDRHYEFHESLVAAAGSPTLMGMRRMLFERARRYRGIAKAYRTKPRARTQVHRAILEAVMDRDVERTRNLIATHCRETMDTVLSIGPQIFAAA